MEIIICYPVMSVTVDAMLKSSWGQKLRQRADGGHAGKPEERILGDKTMEVPITSHPAPVQRMCRVNLSQMCTAD